MTERVDITQLRPTQSHCLAWSEDGELAVAAEDYVVILLPLYYASSQDSNPRRWHEVRIKTNEFTEEEWPQQPLRPFKDFSIGEEQSSSHVVSIAWSPAGLATHRRCVLAILTSNHLLSFWAPLSDPKLSSAWERIAILDPHGTDDTEQNDRTDRVVSFCWAGRSLLHYGEKSADGLPSWGPFYLAAAYDKSSIVQIFEVSQRQTSKCALKFQSRAHFVPQSLTSPESPGTFSLYGGAVKAKSTVTKVLLERLPGRQDAELELICTVFSRSAFAHYLVSVAAPNEFACDLIPTPCNDSLPNHPGEYVALWCMYNNSAYFFSAVQSAISAYELEFDRAGKSKAPRLLDRSGEVRHDAPKESSLQQYHASDITSFKAHKAHLARTQILIVLPSSDLHIITSSKQDTTMDQSDKVDISGLSIPTLRTKVQLYKEDIAREMRIDLNNLDLWCHGLAASGDQIAFCFTAESRYQIQYKTYLEETAMIALFRDGNGNEPSRISGHIDTQLQAKAALNTIYEWILPSRLAKVDLDETSLKILYDFTMLPIMDYNLHDAGLSEKAASLLDFLKRNRGDGPSFDKETALFSYLLGPGKNDSQQTQTEIEQFVHDRYSTLGSKNELTQLLEICSVSGCGHYITPESVSRCKCTAGHPFGSRCSITLRPILAPGLTKICSRCARVALRDEFPDPEAEQAQKDNGAAPRPPNIKSFLLGRFDVCPYCKGKYYTK